MAVLLHVFFNAREASVVANIKIAGIITVPLKVGATGDGIVLTTHRGAKLIAPERSIYAENVGKVLRGNVSAAYTKLTASVFGNWTNTTEKLMNFFATIINFALIYNTRINILGRKELNLRFFEGPPNLVVDGKILIKYNLAGIIFSLIKILFAR